MKMLMLISVVYSFSSYAMIDIGDPAMMFASQSQGAVTQSKPKVEPNYCMTGSTCSGPSVLAKDYTDFLFSFAALTKTNETDFIANCSCLRETLITQYSKEDLEKERTKAREEVNAKIKSAFAKKFVNDFSSNLEDLSFFLTKNRDMFKDPEKAKMFQCLDPDGFNEQIDFICKANGITDPAVIKSKKDSFINGVDKGNLPFEERLMKMSEDIVSMEYKGKVYTRFEYDSARMGLAHSDPKAKIADEILKKLILSPTFSADITPQLIQSPPALAIESIFTAKRAKDGALEGMGLSPEALAVVKDPVNLKQHFQFLMNTHPGFMSIMEDKETLRNLEAEVKMDPTKSILDQLETNPNVLEPVWGRKCLEMQEEYALIVCTPDEKLVSVMDPHDYQNLIKPDALETQSGDARDLLMCEDNNKNTTKLKGLSKLNPGVPSHRSDYLERLLVPEVTDHKNMFSKSILASMDKDFREKMGEMVVRGSNFSKSVSLKGIVSAKVYANAVVEDKLFSYKKPLMSKSEAKAYMKEYKEKSLPANALASSKPVDQVKTTSQFSSKASIVPSKTTQVPEVTGGPREQLKKHLARSGRPPEEIDRSLSQVDTKSLAELNRLKMEENDILEKRYEIESKRLELMQQRVEALQNKVSGIQNSKAPAAVPDEEEREVVQRVIASGKVENTSKKPELPKTSTTTALNPPVTFQPENVETSQGRGNPTVPELTVQAASTVESDIKEEVQKLIESQEPLSETLEEIKLTGLRIMIQDKEVIVKYESLDQHLKDLLELRFAKKERDQQVSKLAVLRLLLVRS